ncbi:MAG: alanine--tRNA ligase-related protein, partial [Candidatus Micrarchaeia archaeon]
KVPENFYTLLRKEDETGKPAEPKVDVAGTEKTKTLFFDCCEEFDATVLSVKGKYVVLDATAFYPEGGGQIYDIGTLEGKKVKNVQKEKGVILHEVEDPFSFAAGQKVHGIVDGNRRRQIAHHHTAIHLINACARETLGQHIWQGGSYKDEHKAHIDLTHYRNITWDELEKMELLANKYVDENLPVKTEILGRNEAEQKYGFRLYQGGAVPGKELRVVSIGNIDHQACGGTHGYSKSTADFGLVKIVRREGVQDGVERVVIKTGQAALEHIQARERLLREAAEALNVPEEQLKPTIMRFFNEWKERGKEIEKLQAILSLQISDHEAEKAEKSGKKTIELLQTPYTQKLVEEVCAKLSENGFSAVISNQDGFIAAVAPKGSGVSALELLKSHGARGGGSQEFARGKVENK